VLLSFFYVSLSRWGRVPLLPVGKVAFACYSRSSRSSLICLAWEQYKLAQVLNSNLISELLKKIQMEKITSKNTNRALHDTNADKTTVLLSHLRNNYVFIVGYGC